MQLKNALFNERGRLDALDYCKTKGKHPSVDEEMLIQIVSLVRISIIPCYTNKIVIRSLKITKMADMDI
jgi:hypothetical protein